MRWFSFPSCYQQASVCKEIWRQDGSFQSSVTESMIMIIIRCLPFSHQSVSEVQIYKLLGLCTGNLSWIQERAEYANHGVATSLV